MMPLILIFIILLILLLLADDVAATMIAVGFIFVFSHFVHDLMLFTLQFPIARVVYISVLPA